VRVTTIKQQKQKSKQIRKKKRVARVKPHFTSSTLLVLSDILDASGRHRLLGGR